MTDTETTLTDAPEPTPPTTEETADFDAWGKVAVNKAKAAPQPGTTGAKVPKPAYGPWPTNGKKYPSAFDYDDAPTAKQYNAWLDKMAPPGLAQECKVGQALYATQIYYAKDVDVHPLLQLATAGLFFGAGWGKAYFEAKGEKTGAKDDAAEAAKLAEAMA